MLARILDEEWEGWGERGFLKKLLAVWLKLYIYGVWSGMNIYRVGEVLIQPLLDVPFIHGLKIVETNLNPFPCIHIKG